MTQDEPIALDDLWWAEPVLKDRLRSDPLGALKEQGINLPADVPVGLAHEVLRLVSLIWLNGKLTPRSKFTIDPFDEGLLFGKGIWESTRTFDHAPWLWDAHIERLTHSAGLLGIAIQPERLPSAAQVTEFVKSLTSLDVVVRLNVTAGVPGKPGIVWMTAAPLPAPYLSVTLQTVASPVPKDQPYLVWKTFQYATRLRVGQSVRAAGFDTALLIDQEGNLLEASHANIFLRLPSGWVTPALNGGFLPGTLRAHVVKHSPLSVREEKVSIQKLSDCLEVFLTNSNAGIVPVTRIDGRQYAVGPETKRLMEWLAIRADFKFA